jgi:hypothetical protein
VRKENPREEGGKNRERRNPDRIEGKSEKGEPPRGGRKEQGKEKPGEK